ncbi:MAG: putative quinol monooxygenase [Planctomycetota bacterium]|nr:putative quinol monooxygenase [Planctomycetota bacterium]
MQIIIAEMKANPGKREQVADVLEKMLQPSRNEQGCISYRFFYSHDDSDVILFYEQWRDMAAIKFHFETEHFQQLKPQLDGLLSGDPKIEIFEATAVAAP